MPPPWHCYDCRRGEITEKRWISEFYKVPRSYDPKPKPKHVGSRLTFDSF